MRKDIESNPNIKHLETFTVPSLENHTEINMDLYRFANVEEAYHATKIPKLHIRECLNEGCCYEGWTFDYAIEKEDCV